MKCCPRMAAALVMCTASAGKASMLWNFGVRRGSVFGNGLGFRTLQATMSECWFGNMMSSPSVETADSLMANCLSGHGGAVPIAYRHSMPVRFCMEVWCRNKCALRHGGQAGKQAGRQASKQARCGKHICHFSTLKHRNLHYMKSLEILQSHCLVFKDKGLESRGDHPLHVRSGQFITFHNLKMFNLSIFLQTFLFW